MQTTKENIRIAFIKQDVYQDLYVCADMERDPVNILFSSQGRVGPIGLMADLNADFLIVREESDWETQIYRKVVPHKISQHLHLLKENTLDKIPGQEFKIPGSDSVHSMFSKKASDIDWSRYDIVISVNVTLPTRIIRRYPQTLFAYMIGEANAIGNRVGFGYDVSLNQQARGRVAQRCRTNVDFPYTFLKGDTLERLMRKALNRDPRKKGVFMEINSTTERPVVRVPDHFLPLQAQGQEIVLHQQKISDNLEAIYDARYFVKMGGRKIRGNSVAEAVSLGTLAIMNRDEVIHGELIIDECHVKTMDEVIALINRLEADPAEYERLMTKQRAILTELFFEKPLESLINCLSDKRHRDKPCSYLWFSQLIDRILFFKMK